MEWKSLRFGRWRELLGAINAREPKLHQLTDGELRKASLSLRHRAKCLEPLDRLLPEAYALVREAARRSVHMRHFDVQILGGIAMHNRSIVEMQTGEGKTLAATLPLYLNALTSRGVHLATVNPYLARRDAEWMGPIYKLLGLTVGVIVPGMADGDRRKSYAADVTYGAGNEFGFDFLRDRLLSRAVREGATDLLGGMLGDHVLHERPMQRSAHYMIVDEADSILIDGAVTPLIIGTMLGEKERIAAECYGWSAEAAQHFKDVDHYAYDSKRKSAELTAAGRRLVRDLPKPPALDTVAGFTIYEYVERAIMVNRAFTREQRYVVRDGEIVVVDEYTGRLAESVKWTHGIHQALEAKEGIAITPETGHSARVTVQSFYSRYEKLAGMTGTALSSGRELRRIYRVGVVEIPVNRPALRECWPNRIFGTQQEKLALVPSILGLAASGQTPETAGSAGEAVADLVASDSNTHVGIDVARGAGGEAYSRYVAAFEGVWRIVERDVAPALDRPSAASEPSRFGELSRRYVKSSE